MIEVAGPEIRLNSETNFYVGGGLRFVRVSTVLKEFGFVKEFGSDVDLARGHAVHYAVRLIEKGTLDWASVDELIEGRVRAYMKFKKETGFKSELSEVIVANPIFHFAGQLDLYGPLFGHPSIIDIKSGPTPKFIRLQTGAYLSALRLTLNQNSYWAPRRYGLELRENGSYSLTDPFKGREDENVFNGLAAAWWYKFNLGLTNVKS